MIPRIDFRLFLLIILLLLLLPNPTLTQNISINGSLTATQTSSAWLSPNGDFALGFQQLRNNSDQFILSIWFDKIPTKTIVWYERTSYPVPRGSTLRLDASVGLLLHDPQGRRLYSSTGGGAANRVGYASMNDTGNFVIFGSDSSVLWESFRHPADTILPTQTIEINETLISRRTESDFSMGRFYAFIANSGNFVFNTKSVPSNSDYDDEYYSSLTSSSPNASDGGVRVVFSGGALISVVRRNGAAQILSSRSIPLPSDNYYRAILEFDGVFRLYYHPKNSGDNPTWQVAGSWPDNICLNINGEKGSGACGYNSMCRIENRRPVCECLKGFSLADPSNVNGDCKPRFVQGCIDGEETSSPEDVYDLEVITDTDWPWNDYEQINPSSEDQCRSSCLNDCFCGVAVYRNNSCWKKKLPLSYGRVDTNLRTKAFLKLRKSDPTLPNPARRRDRRQTLIVIISVLLGSSAFINFLFITAACLLLYLVYKKKSSPSNPVQDSNLRCFTYKELVQATNGFKEELGRGAFGIVYKGTMAASSETMIAVKRLDRVFQDSDKEFTTEVNVIGRTHHKNLVGLIGFCEEGPHRLLVYEYMSNGTLATFLFGDPKPSWRQRARMAVGIAKGLAYLHEECSSQIIHCDIKPQNILLDESYTPRISDFGLAKLLTMNQSKTLTNIRGTKGYVAPEWFRNTQISVKVDVYSFGVVLLEIVSCRRMIEDPILTDWAWDCLVERRLDALVEKDEEALRDREMVERFVKVGLWCVEEDEGLRPTMMKACQMLEGVVQVPEPELPSSFSYVV